MRVLVACEESQVVCLEFRKRGHEAYSCDIQPCSGGHPQWHIEGDVIPILREKWDLIIAHPPRTYLSNAGAARLYPTKGNLNMERFAKGVEAREFFMKFYNHPCDKICIENPIPTRVFGLPPYTQIIQPYEYGHPYMKKTCLWLRGLPRLIPTDVVEEGLVSFVSGGSKDSNGNPRKRKTTTLRSSKDRSKTFLGIAQAMAEQWGV